MKLLSEIAKEIRYCLFIALFLFSIAGFISHTDMPEEAWTPPALSEFWLEPRTP